MEKDQVNEELTITNSTSGSKEFISRSIDDSKNLSEFPSQSHTETSIAKEMEDSIVQESPKDSASHLDFSSVSASVTEIENSLVMVSKSALHGYTVNTEIKPCIPKLLNALGKSENSNLDITRSDSNRPPSFFSLDNFAETTNNSNHAIISSDSSQSPSSFAADFDEKAEHSNSSITLSDSSRPPSSFAVDNFGEITNNSNSEITLFDSSQPPNSFAVHNFGEKINNSNPKITLSDFSRPSSSFAVDNFGVTADNSNSDITLFDSNRPPSSFAVDFDEKAENSNSDITLSDSSRPPSSFAVDNFAEPTDNSNFDLTFSDSSRPPSSFAVDNSNPEITLSDANLPPSLFAVANFDKTTNISNSDITLSDSSRPPSSFAVDNFGETADNSNYDITLSDSSRPPSSSAVDNFGGTTESSSFPELLELPFANEPKFKSSDFCCGSTNAASNEKSPDQLYEQQNQSVSHESLNLNEGEVFMMEISDEGDGHENLSVPGEPKPLPSSAPTFEEALRDDFDEYRFAYKYNIGQPSPEGFSNANWPEMMRNEQPSSDSGNSSESSNNENQDVCEKPSETPSERDHIRRGRNISERSSDWMEIKTSNFGFYFEVSHARISEVHIAEVLKRMKENHYLSSGNKIDLKIYGYCKYLFQKSNRIKVVHNEQGTLCKRYPAKIIVPYENCIPKVERKTHKEFVIIPPGEICKHKFLAPTLFLQEGDGIPQLISRCAALSVKEPSESETAKGSEGGSGSSASKLKHIKINGKPVVDVNLEIYQGILNLREKEYREKCAKDQEVVKIFQFSELMLEDKKKKLWISLNPTENIYEDFDSEFDIVKLPFPDCDYFRRYYESGRKADGLLWDGSDMGTDIVTITQNYIETICTYLMRENRSMVIHCHSGYDQTCLFIVLLRISLWADLKAHIGLDEYEILYLTLAYDWYFAGHNLLDCMERGEEMLHFCYNFLQYLYEDKFSPEIIKTSYMGACFSTKQDKQNRMLRIKTVRQIALQLYDEHILQSSE